MFNFEELKSKIYKEVVVNNLIIVEEDFWEVYIYYFSVVDGIVVFLINVEGFVMVVDILW